MVEVARIGYIGVGFSALDFNDDQYKMSLLGKKDDTLGLELLSRLCMESVMDLWLRAQRGDIASELKCCVWKENLSCLIECREDSRSE